MSCLFSIVVVDDIFYKRGQTMHWLTSEKKIIDLIFRNRGSIFLQHHQMDESVTTSVVINHLHSSWTISFDFMVIDMVIWNQITTKVFNFYSVSGGEYGPLVEPIRTRCMRKHDARAKHDDPFDTQFDQKARNWSYHSWVHDARNRQIKQRSWNC